MTNLNNEHCYSLDQSIQSDKSLNASWLNGAISFISKLATSIQNRNAATPLLNATDHELKDMGLSRKDLYFIRNAGVFIDPTQELARRSHYSNRLMKL